MIALVNHTFFEGDKAVSGKAVLIEGQTIKAILDSTDLPPGAQVIDCGGAWLSSGLIDLQIYGAGGYLFSAQPTADVLHAICDAIVKTGTTGFLLTMATNSLEVFSKAIKTVQDHPHPALLGLHFEGPYINPERRGAHLLEYIRKPQLNEVTALIQEAAGVLKMITLAPEYTDPAVIALLAKNEIIVSAGHSNATQQQAKAGFEHGVVATTHLFNAMSPLHHRDAGLPGATFLSNACASIIADGIHVSFDVLKLSKQLMGERLFLITDAVDESSEGPYVHQRQSDRFTLPDGTLSGSSLTMLHAVKNCVEQAAISLPEALRMATAYPAKLLGNNRLGTLTAGAQANLLLFNRDYTVAAVYLRGKKVSL